MSDVYSKHDQHIADGNKFESILGENILATDDDKSHGYEAIKSSLLFNLNVDCFEEIFEWLSLADLRALRQTCRRLKQVVDYYINLSYPLMLRKLPIRDYHLKYLEHTDSNCFNLVNQMTFLTSPLITAQIEAVKHILSRCESISIESVQIKGDFFDTFLKFCKQLKCLFISKIKSNKVIGDGDEWMQHKYPTLEHISLQACSYSNVEIESFEFKEFCELNSSIKMFSTNFEFLWMNRNWILESNIRLDVFAVNGACNSSLPIDSIFGLLTQLFQQEFYQRLHITASWIDDQQIIDQILSLKSLEKLCLRNITVKISFPSFPNLKMLSFYAYEHFAELNINHLVNLEQIYFVFASINDIVPFIVSCAKLSKITVDHLENGIYFKNDIINLSALNNEREKLAGAQKLLFYVPETILLKHKWTTKIKYNLIELKRAQADVREQPFLFGKQQSLF